MLYSRGRQPTVRKIFRPLAPLPNCSNCLARLIFYDSVLIATFVLDTYEKRTVLKCTACRILGIRYEL